MEFPHSWHETPRRDFVAGLERLLRDQPGLGPDMLVLNNALIDAGAVWFQVGHRVDHTSGVG